MNKWGDIKELTLNKLFLTEDEASQQGYLEKMLSFANEGLVIISNSFKAKEKVLMITTTQANETIEMPNDFLSFNDRECYLDGIAGARVYAISNKLIQLPIAGVYLIPYNALWGFISEEDVSDNIELDIDYSIIQCLPLYIASQLLSQDDIQRSTILRNEFELMCDRLDDDNNEISSFSHRGGWV